MADRPLDDIMVDEEDEAHGRHRSGRVWSHPFTLIRRVFGHAVFSSLTRRILFFNIAATVVLAGGILYLNQFREGLIDARVESLLTQGEIIAGAISASASVDTNSITIDNPAVMTYVLKRSPLLIRSVRTRCVGGVFANTMPTLLRSVAATPVGV